MMQEINYIRVLIYKWLFVAFAFCVSIYAKGQEYQFSQFYFTPFSTNPAYAGNLPEDLRFTAIHRSQWMKTGSSLTSSGAAFDMNFEGGKLNDSKLGVGFAYVDDHIIEGLIRRSDATLSLAWHKPLDGLNRTKLSIGASGTYHSINVAGPENFLWGTEFDHFGRAQTLNLADVGEDYQGGTTGSIRINYGMILSHELTSKLHMDVGYALYNINRPQANSLIGLSVSDVPIHWKHIGTAHLVQKLGTRSSIEYSSVFNFHSGAENVIVGAFYVYNTRQQDDYNKLYIGPWYRLGAMSTQNMNNTLILAAAYKLNHWRLGMSYDVATSNLRTLKDAPNVQANTVRTWEISITYVGLLFRAAADDYTVPCKFF